MGAHKSKNPLVLSEKEIRFIQHKTGMSRDDVLYFHRDFIVTGVLFDSYTNIQFNYLSL